MRLSSFTDFGLRALMRMASESGRAYSTAELADEFGLSRHHLTKIMAALAQAGIVTTRRGGGGGARLGRPAGQITLGDIVRVLENDHALVSCFAADGGTCTITSNCRLKVRLRRAETAFFIALDQSTLADVALAPRAANRHPIPDRGPHDRPAKNLNRHLGHEIPLQER